MTNKVLNFFSKIIERAEPEFTLKLDRIIYSDAHHCEACVIQLVGKNAWPIMTTNEILSDPKIVKGLSGSDIVVITRLDEEIKRRIEGHKILEIDKNGTVLLEDKKGRIKRYAEKTISSNPEILSGLSSIDAHNIGYRVGFKDGLAITLLKKTAKKMLNFKNKP